VIIVDTSVWVEHLRNGHRGLEASLRANQVAAHPWVIGELALGGASSGVMELLGALPRAAVAEPAELLQFIDTAALPQTGIGWVDAQLLASARLSPGGLRAQADRLGLAAHL
jgi:predicted nucleic acid-binding protein